VSGTEQSSSRAAVQACREEQQVVREAYEFLDEKRLTLAAELLRQLQRYEQLRGDLMAAAASGRARLRSALQRHGLQGLSVYPAQQLQGCSLRTRQHNLMGVVLAQQELELSLTGQRELPQACNPSYEAMACQSAFVDILRRSALLAEVSGNIHRLLLEYRVTERRARALENVILPEIRQRLATMTTLLEEMDQEDVIRAYRFGKLSQFS
jgi:V/A-type H+-transporting ATPase subunit D